MNHLVPARELEPQALAQRAGSRNFNGPRQIYKPAPIILANADNGEGGSYTTKVRVPVPDSRCRVKLSVLFFPFDGAALPDISGAGTIWVYAADEDQKGVSGSGGRTAPVTNLVGTQAAPLSFPVAAGLQGYSREFVTATDWLEAVITINAGGGRVGTWVLQTRIQPDAVTLDWEEWDEIRRLFAPENNGGQGNL